MGYSDDLEKVKSQMPLVFDSGKFIGHDEGYQEGFSKAKAPLILDGHDLGRPLLTWGEFINSSRNTIGLKVVMQDEWTEIVKTADDKAVLREDEVSSFTVSPDDIIDPVSNSYSIADW